MNSPLTNFVVGPSDQPIVTTFTLVWKDGSPNIQATPLPPLNRNGLLRLAKHLEALANLIEYGQGYRTPTDKPGNV